MNEEKLRAFVRGYWEQADHETKAGEPSMTMVDPEAQKWLELFLEKHGDYWYERGIKDLAEMVLGKLGQ